MKNIVRYHKIALFLLLFGASSQSIAQTEQKIKAVWDCVDVFDFSTENEPIIKAWTFAEYFSNSGDSYNGIIEANGIHKNAVYYQQGLTHRWDFDFDEEKESYAASFVIEPNNKGSYYYFGREDNATPSILTTCTKTK